MKPDDLWHGARSLAGSAAHGGVISHQAESIAEPSRIVRLRELDALRGLAACAVLLHHGLASTNLLQGSLGGFLASSPLQVLESGRPAVLFFFVLSGFVLTRALDGTQLIWPTLKRWALQRSVRLVLPAAAAVLLSATLQACLDGGCWPGEASWLRNTVWTSPLAWQAVGRQATLSALDGGYGFDNALWSLAIEWRISILLPLVAIPALFRDGRGACCLLLVGAGLACFIGGAAATSFYAGDSALGALRATIYFALPFIVGIALERSGASRVRPDRLLTASSFVAIVGLARTGNDLAIFAASALLIWLAQQPGSLRRLLLHPTLTWFGTVSFSLYLVHEPILAALHHSLHHRLPALAVAALGVGAAPGGAWLFHLGVERPVHRLARTIGHVRLAVRASARHAVHAGAFGHDQVGSQG